MTLRGSAFLALWNDVDPAREAEYDDWHAVEHVPKRVGITGFLAGRRCVAARGGAGARRFTLYELEDLAALSGQAYAEVVDRPTEWSKRMRPTLRTWSAAPARRSSPSVRVERGRWLLSS